MNKLNRERQSQVVKALYFMHYNFARPHKTLSKPYATTPAMAAGLTDHVWETSEIIALLDRSK